METTKQPKLIDKETKRELRFPEDFEILLLDELQWEEDEIVEIKISQGNPEDHREEFLNDLSHWSSEDFRTATAYLDIMTTQVSELPPLVASEPCGLLQDGYHRLFGLLILGVKEYPIIYISENRKKE